VAQSQGGIEQFRGEHFFLSNMYPLAVPIRTDRGVRVATSEHAYQAEKFVELDVHWRVAKARVDDGDVVKSGIYSKDLAHEFIHWGADMRPNWDMIKLGVMETVLRRKFIANPDIAEQLAATDDRPIAEGNNWRDRYWGVDPVGSDNGQNQLGKLLMRLRTEIQNGELR